MCLGVDVLGQYCYINNEREVNMNMIDFLTDMGVDVVVVTDDDKGKEKVTNFKGKEKEVTKTTSDEEDGDPHGLDFNNKCSPIHY